MNDQTVYAAPQSNLEERDTTKERYELASRWARLGASILDSVIAAAISFPLMYYSGTWDKIIRGEYPIFEIAMFGVLGLIVFLALHGYLLAKYGQTIGKRVAGIKIVSRDSITLLPLPRLFLLRYLPAALAAHVPTIGQLLSFVNVVFIFRADKRCVHDLIAGTIVIKANQAQESIEGQIDSV